MADDITPEMLEGSTTRLERGLESLQASITRVINERNQLKAVGDIMLAVLKDVDDNNGHDTRPSLMLRKSVKRAIALGEAAGFTEKP